MFRITQRFLPFLTLAALACMPRFAQAQVCPLQSLISDGEICWGDGGFDNPQNVVSGTYAPTQAFVPGSEICIQLDVVAEIENGGWDRVFLRWDDGQGSPADVCLVGDSPGNCVDKTEYGCVQYPTQVWDISDQYCFQPKPGATQLTISVWVAPADLEFQCGDCPPGGNPHIEVTNLTVTGCNGFPVEGKCGNAVLEAGESCDDGNTIGEDGCDQDCAIEDGGICNDAGTECQAADSCNAVTPGNLNVSYCYATGDDPAATPLVWSWKVDSDGSPLLLHWDIDGGVELTGPVATPEKPIAGPYDVLVLEWFDDKGKGDLIILNHGGVAQFVFFHAWSKASVAIDPTPGAKKITARLSVFSDPATSCQKPPAGVNIKPVRANVLQLSSCDTKVTSYDDFASFEAAAGPWVTVVDFNDLADGTEGPITGDGFSIDADSAQPDVVLTVSDSPYWTTEAIGDGTPALEPQLNLNYETNSRLRVDFVPKPAKAIAMSFVDAGDGGGILRLEGWRDGKLVKVINDMGVSGPDNNFVSWKGYVFDQPVDAVTFHVIEVDDFFNIDNLVVVAQADSDEDGTPDPFDCEPDNPAAAGGFVEICDDGIDNDCDDLVDGDDPECNGQGSVACATYAEADPADGGAGWIVTGDPVWQLDEGPGVWKVVSTGSQQSSTLETKALAIPADACDAAFDLEVVFTGSTGAASDPVIVEMSVNGGPYDEIDSVAGNLGPRLYDISGSAAPGDTVSLRFTYASTGFGSPDAAVSKIRIFSDEDADGDQVCDACDCAPAVAAFGFDCDLDDDGWCAVAAAQLNSDPAVAGCPEDTGAGASGSGTDCHDNSATANPGNNTESPFCSDGLDNDCDGLVDLDDPDCAATVCSDKDGDGYGKGNSCIAGDCDDTAPTCTTDCSDSDGDGIADCKDSCIDLDGDGYGVGSGCTGSDCDDTIPSCNTDCTTDINANGVPDCAEDCADGDGDGYGVGSGCTGEDCDDTSPQCTTDCSDTDGDQVLDC